MRRWWNERTRREKGLLGAASLLLLMAVAWQGVIQPAAGALETAEQRHAEALQTLMRIERLEELVAEGHFLSSGQPDQSPAALVDAALQLADELGLEGLRISPAENGEIRVEGTGVPGPGFFTWAEVIQAQLGLTIKRASVTAVPGGSLDVGVQLTGTAEK